ncbi:MAG: hypothetical protein HY716_16305 [Planctomycetes bacterium]|nr:hypothetical protein [Gammaproteobacteria bacterium]MBI4566248.1 hypothetical protein [Planctomycetota bacterium]
MKYAVAMASILLAAGASMADEIYLKNGNKIVGIAREEGDRVVVELGFGTVGVPRSEVTKIVRGPTALSEYPTKYDLIQDSTKATDFFRLALWTKDEGLSRYTKRLLERTIELDPDHAAARDMLGYVRHDGRWMTKVEYLIEQGFVEFRGQWVKASERDSILAREAAEREKERLESEDGQAEREPKKKVKGSVPYFGLQPYPYRYERRRYSPWLSYGGVGWGLQGCLTGTRYISPLGRHYGVRACQYGQVRRWRSPRWGHGGVWGAARGCASVWR